LQRSLRGPKPIGWDKLIAQLKESDGTTPVHQLLTPLSLTLIRDTYRGGDDVRELLRFLDAGSNQDTPEKLLLGRLLPYVYSDQPGRPRRKYDAVTAEKVLRCIAAELDRQGRHEFGWWEVPLFTSSRPRIAVTTTLFGLAFGLAHALVANELSLPTFLPGFAVGIALGLAYGTRLARGHGAPRALRASLINRKGVLIGSAGGVIGGVLFGITVALGAELIGSRYAGLYGTMFGGASGLGIALFTLANGRQLTGESPRSPLQTWRDDRAAASWIGLAVGLAFGFTIGIADGIGFGPLTGVLEGVVFGASFWLSLGLLCSRSWFSTLAWLQMSIERRMPLVRLMPFLEYARELGVLRTIGRSYEFRHSLLQLTLIENNPPPH
jgi:hypothetical protein